MIASTAWWLGLGLGIGIGLGLGLDLHLEQRLHRVVAKLVRARGQPRALRSALGIQLREVRVRLGSG